MQFSEATEEEILTEIAQQGERKHVLWELASDGRDFCGIQFVATELGIADDPLSAVVTQFIEDTDAHIEAADINWGHLEETYGDLANEFTSRA